MSNEFILLLVGLAVGGLLSIILLVKIIFEVKKTRTEFTDLKKDYIKQFQKEFNEKHTKKSDS